MSPRLNARVLVVNGNASEEVTRIVATAARAATRPENTVHAITATNGPTLVQTPADLRSAERACINAVRRHVAGCDGVVVAVSLDTAVEVLAAELAVPVVGMTQPAIDAAAGSSRRLGVLTMGQAMREMFLTRFRLPANALIQVVDLSPREILQARRSGDPVLADRLIEGIRRLARDGADAALPIGATVAGLAADLEPSSPIPVLECIAVAVADLERRIDRRRRDAHE